ncbi:putative selenate reductase molybdopterin-binding subunit, partial [Mytilus galloprovincialis]
VVAETLGVAANKILVRVKRLGGGFGGKETRSICLTTPVALAAYKLKKPVRCMLDRDEDMLITGTRHPFLGQYKVGFTKEGKVVAADVNLYNNAGCTFDLSGAVVEKCLLLFDYCYKIENLGLVGYACKTNIASNTAFRGFGGPQGMLIMETLMDEVSSFLHLDPDLVLEQALLMFENCYKIENLRLTGYVCKTNIPSNTAFRGFGTPQSMLVTETFMDEISGSLDHSPEQVLDRGLFHLDNAYKIANFKAVGRTCKTNIPSNTAFRGFGGPQGMVVAETFIDEVATYLNFCPSRVRKLNMYNEGDLTHFGQVVEDCNVRKCWEECKDRSEFIKRKRDVEIFNSENRWKKRGICMIPTKFGIAYTATFLNQAGALVMVYRDGSVLVTHGGVEMGQGLHTKMIQVASRVLKIPTTKIHISETSTNTVPNTSATAASASSDLNGMAVKVACQTILERISPYQCQP